MSKGSKSARPSRAQGALFGAVALSALLSAGSVEAGGMDARHSDAEVAPSTVALAVLPSTASVADMEARDSRMPWPTHGWLTSTPEAQGLDSSVLAAAMERIRARHLPVHSLLIARHGRLVLDAYFAPFADGQMHDVYSVTKSVVSTLVGMAMRERRISDLRTPVLAMVPDADAAGDPWKQRLTLAHMLSMTSGLDCRGNGSGNFLQAMEQSRHWTQFALERQIVSTPGSTFAYCAGNMQVMSAVLSHALGESAADFARRELFAPLGIEQVSWAADRDGVSHGFSDLKMQPRDMAKLGLLWLHRGVWEGRQIVPASYLDSAFAPHASVEAYVKYGYGMWIYPYRGHAGGAPDIEANGFGGQRIAVIPSQDMVVVITGSGLDANDVASLITNAVRSDSPLPPNAYGNMRLAMRVAEAAGGAGTRYAANLSGYVASRSGADIRFRLASSQRIPHRRHHRATTLAMR